MFYNKDFYMQREFQFYIVPTPIGNLNDISLRALDVLKSVDFIACEDTRTTQNLLNHYNIKTKTFSYHKYNEKSKIDEILKLIKSGNTIALVSDAGTPMICDPGNILIGALIENDIKITSLPGACAISTFLSQIPRDSEYFVFTGFFPRTEKAASDLLLKYSGTNLVFYDSPNRILDTLRLVKKIRGDVKIALGRELSKLFEEVIISNIDDVINHYKDGIKGEIVCMIYSSGNNENLDIELKIHKLKEKGFKSKEISTILSTLYNLNKKDIYKLTME